MTPQETIELIEAAGGNTAFAQLLGITEHPGYLQRVSNWRRRGIPPRVLLEHQPKIEALRRQVSAAA